MANTYFQFKQFRVDQSLVAMKVCTESCVFGALANPIKPARILDIGAGTGLLSLMLAQKYNCPIDAVEIDENAFQQAKLNFELSLWKNNLLAHHTSIQEFSKTSVTKYDAIISNPPFFSDHLKALNSAKNVAIHNHLLSQHDLLTSVKSLLTENGAFYLLLPPSEAEKFDLIALKTDLFLQKRTILYNRPGALPFRFISQYGNVLKGSSQEKLCIRNNKEQYSEAFKILLNPYYLHL